MTDNKNLFAAILICAAVLFGWQYFVAAPQMQKEQQRQYQKLENELGM